MTNRDLISVKTLSELKKFTIGQGLGWLDIAILRHNGFKVVTKPSYESLFRMVAHSRFDLFSRGINEVDMEYKARKSIPGLTLNRTVGVHYPLPRFFFTSIGNKQAAQRVREGLVAAYRDGSLQKLWKKEYGPSLKFGKFNNIKFFNLTNPYLDGVDKYYEKFINKADYGY